MRKPIQLDDGRVLCDDGTIWVFGYTSPRVNTKAWVQLPPIPQDEEKPASA